MAIYLNPRNDLIFKRIFADHPHLLINFLNAVMPLAHGHKIESVEYLPSDLPPDTPTKKYSIVDVRCKDNHKRQFIIEMQMLWDDTFYNRIVFNAGKAYVKQLDCGEKYEFLQPVYTLALLNENFDHATKKFYHHYQIVNRENTNEIIPGLEFVLVELSKKFRAPKSFDDRKLMVLWLRFLREINEKTRKLPTLMQRNKYISQAAKLCEAAAYSPEELAAYDKYWDMISTHRSLISGALRKGEALGLQKGMQKGMQKGEALGMQKGEALGMQKGEALGLQKGLQKVVINCKQAGMTLEEISKITNLTLEEIEQILKITNKT